VKHPDGRGNAIPVHSGETIGRGLMAKILCDLELTREEVQRAL
jgi:predicted RNA binding protein YcfA (HicA-like mRNA interferase family)